ncbi:hypothetical protein [Asticcacaulis sp. 201]|uniref:hypothetical protein n=1 Tax=Asticcacaulis sp. 201 TaxID=3028787 RepID=UPI002916FF1D|nr:hypothetical protein [Asticcacaulis sp. 201]MDV6330080.1 hypothetical protein [Asticcacaulis sp. 201]
MPMPLARKLILHVPVSDEALLADFVKRCVADGVVLIAVFGLGCERIQRTIGALAVGGEIDQTFYLCTSIHPDETLDEVVDMVRSWEFEQSDSFEEIRL